MDLSKIKDPPGDAHGRADAETDHGPHARMNILAHDAVLSPWFPELKQKAHAREVEFFQTSKKGRSLSQVLETLPDLTPSSVDLSRSAVRIGTPADLEPSVAARLEIALKALKPWRKGPFEIFGIDVDSEWDSSLKWDRLAAHLPSQEGRRVLDIGSSCGYYLFRMAHQKPAMALGIEPYLTYYGQFLGLSRYLALPNVCCLPLGVEDLPEMRWCFDTVLCMGILYHRRSPLDTLHQLHPLLIPGGQLVLETLIVEGDDSTVFFPRTRYAGMRNVFFIPTCACLFNWLARCGFENIRCVNISKTTSREQRKTDWIDTFSLEDVLDKRDPEKTIEGYPAPRRAMVLATACPR